MQQDNKRWSGQIHINHKHSALALAFPQTEYHIPSLLWKNVTSSYHLETEHDENKKSDPWVVALPAASPSNEGEMIRSLNQHTLLTERLLSSCQSVFHTCTENSSAYLSNMTRSASLDKRTNPGVPSVRMNWIFSLCKQKKNSKIAFANKAPMYTTATRKSTGCIKNLWVMLLYFRNHFFPLPHHVHVSSKILQPKS